MQQKQNISNHQKRKKDKDISAIRARLALRWWWKRNGKSDEPILIDDIPDIALWWELYRRNDLVNEAWKNRSPSGYTTTGFTEIKKRFPVHRLNPFLSWHRLEKSRAYKRIINEMKKADKYLRPAFLPFWDELKKRKYLERKNK